MSDSQTKNIVAAIKKSFNNKFLHSIRNLKNPYGNGTASKKIVKELKRIKLKNILKKNSMKLNFKNKKVFIIAEAGVNHNGKLKNALALVDVAVNAKADAINISNFFTWGINRKLYS